MANLVTGPVYYKWQWVYSVDSGVMSESNRQFSDEIACEEEAMNCKPLFMSSWDRENNPIAVLKINGYTENGELLSSESLDGRNKVLLTRPIGETACMRVVQYRDQQRIDLRQWVKINKGEIVPTKKGVSMPLQRWVRLKYLKSEVNNVLKKIKGGQHVKKKIHVGGTVFLTCCSPFWTVNIREWYKNVDNKTKPTKRGFILKHDEWDRLMTQDDVIAQLLPEVVHMRPCIEDDDHQNQRGMLMCSECNPFDFEDYSFN